MQKYNCDSQKLQLLRQALNRMHLPFRDKSQVEEAAAGLLLLGEDNLSRHYRKTNRAIKGASLPQQKERRSLLPNIRHIQQRQQHNRDGQSTIQNERNSLSNTESHNLDQQQSPQI
jgi:hypothetical protein